MAIDGKVLRRSHDRGAARAAIDLVSAWAEERRLVLGQRAVDAASNEITAVPALLDLLILDGAIVTVDALHCQTATAAAIREQGADYVLALKTNQPQAYDAVATFFAEAIRDDWQGVGHEHLVTEDDCHGRFETRRYWTSADPDLLAYLSRETEHWPDLGCVGMVERVRVTASGTSREMSYYLSSLDGTVATFARAVRSHWGIENREHWGPDMAFREDESRVRTGDGAENAGMLRRIALNLIRLDRSRKVSVHTKRLKAGWDQHYLLDLLSLSPAQ